MFKYVLRKGKHTLRELWIRQATTYRPKIQLGLIIWWKVKENKISQLLEDRNIIFVKFAVHHFISFYHRLKIFLALSSHLRNLFIDKMRYLHHLNPTKRNTILTTASHGCNQPISIIVTYTSYTVLTAQHTGDTINTVIFIGTSLGTYNGVYLYMPKFTGNIHV